MSKPTIIKKYGNRRLYDTGESRYITLDELAELVHGGTDVRVVDARTGADLTQVTLTQIIIEGRGAARMLPVSLLTQLIRLGDDALAEFFGRYVTAALELYLQARRGVQAMTPLNPFATLPLAASSALARMWMGAGAPPPPAAWPADDAGTAEEDDEPVGPARARPAAQPASSGEVAALREELAELRRALSGVAAQQDQPARDRGVHRDPPADGEETPPRKPRSRSSKSGSSKKRRKAGS